MPTPPILTTHVGSLPGPAGFAADGTEPDDALREAVAWAVARQREARIDVINEGELTKGGDWLAYADNRFGGFDARPPGPGYVPIIRQGLDREEFAEFYEWATRRQSLFFAEDGRMATKRPYAVCTGPITYQNLTALQREIGAFRAVAGDGASDRLFLTSTAPASLEAYRANSFYRTEEEFLFAIAEALAVEYRAIVEAGFLLQVDDAWLVALWDRIGVGMGLDAFRKRCALRMEALNHALSGIPEERVRYHICWGSWHGPHAHDLPMKDVVDLMLSVKARYYLFEAANVRHEHEFAVWRDTPLREGKVLVPGCVTHSTDLVEHPELVAQRIERFARLVGPERVMAGTDCGFGGRVHPQIAWAKLKALAQGARIASGALTGA
jgi:5-methyltetrahydropteroyltriglutamate--homocysteine methyltransferase